METTSPIRRLEFEQYKRRFPDAVAVEVVQTTRECRPALVLACPHGIEICRTEEL